MDLLLNERSAKDLLRGQAIVRTAEKPQILLVVAAIQREWQYVIDL